MELNYLRKNWEKCTIIVEFYVCKYTNKYHSTVRKVISQYLFSFFYRLSLTKNIFLC